MPATDVFSKSGELVILPRKIPKKWFNSFTGEDAGQHTTLKAMN